MRDGDEPPNHFPLSNQKWKSISGLALRISPISSTICTVTKCETRPVCSSTSNLMISDTLSYMSACMWDGICEINCHITCTIRMTLIYSK